MSFYKIILTSLFLIGDGSGAPALVVTEGNLGDRVRSQNPDLAAARIRIDEALGRHRQSGRLSNPTLDTAFEHNSRFREGRLEVGFTQKFPVTNRLSLEKQVTATLLQAAEKEVAEVERQLILAARQSLIQVLAIRQRRGLLKEQAELSSRFAGSVDEAAKRGEQSILDAGQARIEGIAVELELRQLDAAEATATGSLKPLLGMTAGEPLNVSGTLALPSQPRVTLNPENRPDLQVARLEERAAGEAVALQYANRREDIEVAAFFAGERSEDAPDGFDNEAIVGMRLKIPLPFWNKNEGRIEEAEATRRRKNLEGAALVRSIRIEVETAHNEMQRWERLARDLQQDLLPLANAQTKRAEEAYGKGQADLLAVFRLREKRLQLAGARLDALREFHLARARYEAACGKP